LYTTTYISYESSNQGLFPLRKMVVIRLVLEDCTVHLPHLQVKPRPDPSVITVD
jgi:hypothetical protein